MPASGYDWVAFGISKSPAIDIALQVDVTPLTLTKSEEHYNFYPVNSFQFYLWVQVDWTTHIESWVIQLENDWRKIKLRFVTNPLTPNLLIPWKFFEILLKKGFLESTKNIIWHDVISNTISKHSSNSDIPCEIDKLLEILTGLKTNFEAILYCRRLGSPNLFQQPKDTGILILDKKEG